MQRITGSADVALIECVNPRKNKWRVRWDVNTTDDGSTSYMEEEYDHKPTIEEVKATITEWYNERVDNKIRSGFVWDGMAVWLSTENQFNYKAAYDLAVQTNGATLPVTFKFGTDEEPTYKDFETLDELADFYTKAMAYVQSVLADGWETKDNIDWTKYEQQ